MRSVYPGMSMLTADMPVVLFLINILITNYNNYFYNTNSNYKINVIIYYKLLIKINLI